MFAVISPSEAQPRAIGEGRLRAELRGGRTRIAALRHGGSAKLLVPRTAGPGLEAVFLNTAGGLTGGDRFRWTFEASADADLTLTTQAAERAYRALCGTTAEVETRLSLAPGATVRWLPQETILFDRSALSRRIEIDMAEDATLLAAETLVFGRAAMGERLGALSFADRWALRRGGRLVWADALRLADAAPLAAAAGLDGNTAAASVVLAAPNAADRLAAARTALEDPALAAGASAFDGILVARLVAKDGYRLRPALARLLTLIGGRPLPRLWTF